MPVENEALTPEAVVRLLMQAHPEASRMEDLRPYLPASFRTLQRWREKGWPKSAADAIQLLRDAGLLAPTSEARVPVAPPSPLAAKLADLEVLMQAGRQAQEKQWTDLRQLGTEIRQLASDVKALSTGIDGLRELVESALPQPGSARERRLGGS